MSGRGDFVKYMRVSPTCSLIKIGQEAIVCHTNILIIFAFAFLVKIDESSVTAVGVHTAEELRPSVRG